MNGRKHNAIGVSAWQWETAWADAADIEELSCLFERAFGHVMPPEQWRWKYAAATPWGVVVRTRGMAVAFYGGMPRGIRMLGREAVAVQIGDVMVEPSHRRILTRRGPLFLAASRFAEDFVGPGKPYHCAYGFPSERHNRLGEHLGLYGRIGALLEAEWDVLPYRRCLTATVRPLEESHLDLLAPLWEELACDLAEHVVLTRDTEYLLHRFFRHPTVGYHLFLLRRRISGTPLGLLVLRMHDTGDLELLDMIGAVRRLPLLVKIARNIAGKLGCRRLFCWLTQAVATAVQSSSPRLKDINIPLPTIIWGHQANILDTRNQWWLTGGDTDFR